MKTDKEIQDIINLYESDPSNSGINGTKTLIEFIQWYEKKYTITKLPKDHTQITEDLYKAYGSGTGVLFGIPSSLRGSVESIVKVVLGLTVKNHSEINLISLKYVQLKLFWYKLNLNAQKNFSIEKLKEYHPKTYSLYIKWVHDNSKTQSFEDYLIDVAFDGIIEK